MNNNYIEEIRRFRRIFEKYKQQVESEQLPCYFAEDKVTKLKKEEKRYRALLTYLKVDKELIEELDTLINETEQFLHDILDIIEIERNQILRH